MPSARARATASAPTKPGRFRATPAEAGLDRVALGRQVIAVQVEAGLEAQGVAGAEPTGDDARVEQLHPDRRRDIGVDQQLDPVLAGVAGPADQRRASADPLRRDSHPRRQVETQRGSDDPAGVRPLDGEHRVAVGHIAHRDVEVAAPTAQPGKVGGVVGRVGDDEVAVAAEPVGEEVVEHAAVLGAEAGVLGAADRDLGDVVGEDPLQEGERARPLDLDLAHVGDVEHPGVTAHREVLFANPLVLDGHLPARKIDQLRPELEVAVVEGGASHRRSVFIPSGSRERRCRRRRHAVCECRCPRPRSAGDSRSDAGPAAASGPAARSPRSRWRSR